MSLESWTIENWVEYYENSLENRGVEYVFQYLSADRPQYLNFLKPLMSIRSDRLVVSLISDQGHYTFIYWYTKHNREGGRKNKRTNTDLGQLQAQERGICATLFVQLSVHL